MKTILGSPSSLLTFSSFFCFALRNKVQNKGTNLQFSQKARDPPLYGKHWETRSKMTIWLQAIYSCRHNCAPVPLEQTIDWFHNSYELAKAKFPEVMSHTQLWLMFYTFPPYALTLYAHNYITHLICIQNSKELQDNPNNLKIASHAGFWNKLYVSAVHRQNFNILEVICLLWMCTPNVCQPFFLIRLSGLSSQCVQLKEKHLIVYSKTDSLQTIPYFPRLSEHTCKLNPDAHSATLP